MDHPMTTPTAPSIPSAHRKIQQSQNPDPIIDFILEYSVDRIPSKHASAPALTCLRETLDPQWSRL